MTLISKMYRHTYDFKILSFFLHHPATHCIAYCCKDKQFCKALHKHANSSERAAEYKWGVGICDNGIRTVYLPNSKVEFSSTFRKPGRRAKADES